MEAEKYRILRIIDANFNRAREGLRVTEEYCRFALDSAVFSAALKALRHDLCAVVRGFAPDAQLLACREIEQDIGRDIKAPDERSRASIEDSVISNLRRTAEALRAIEEYGKILSAGSAEKVEKLRYELYSVEKRLASCLAPKEKLAGAKLYVLLTAELASKGALDAARELVDAGVDIIQLREKAMPDAELLAVAKKLREITLGRALLIINDRPDIAALSGADGVHLGQEDMPPGEAKKLLGSGKIIGVSTHSIEQARAAERAGADYIGVGPVFETATKKHAKAVGLGLVREVAREVRIPFFAIGSVNLETIGSVLESGAERAAVCTGIIAQLDIGKAVALFREILSKREPAIRNG